MENELVLNSVLSVTTLLFIATVVSFFLKKTKIPYTVALVIIGLGIAFLAEQFPVLHFLNDFRLSPELVFYIFLPTLIFESAFHTNLNHFMRNIKPIFCLSTIGMLISTAVVSAGVHYFLGLPWAIAMLFGALISATDPISVIAQFKQIGAPKRLMTILEGESLFNDGMVLVLFGILVEFIGQNNTQLGKEHLFGSFGDFGVVVLGGLLIGVLLGVLFSKALDYVKDSKEVEISITLILAHSTFIIAEYFLGVSGILATVAAGIVIGNYGAFKISPGVKEIMTNFWDYSAFIANSLLFLLVGMIMYSTQGSFGFLFESMLFVIGLVLFARMLMVYTILPTLNVFFKHERIPLAWMHIIQWSGLRGALAIALILTLPENFPYYHEILIFTVGVIFFTIFFNGLSMRPLLSVLGLNSFSALEAFEHEENQLFIDKKVHHKLDEMLKKKFISREVYSQIKAQYERHCDDCALKIQELFKSKKSELCKQQVGTILKRHLLGVERRVFTKLYYYGEITQGLLNVLLNNVQMQMEQTGMHEVTRLGKLTWLSSSSRLARFVEYIGVHKFRTHLRRKEIMLRYEMFRARLIAIEEVLEALNDIEQAKVFPDRELLVEFRERYTAWRAKAKKKLSKLKKENREACMEIQLFLAKQAAFHVEEKALDELQESGMTSPKVYCQLKQALDERRDISI